MKQDQFIKFANGGSLLIQSLKQGTLFDVYLANNKGDKVIAENVSKEELKLAAKKILKMTE